MQKEQTLVAIGEPRINILPLETADTFYEAFPTRISEIIQIECAAVKRPTKNSESEEDKV